MCFLLWFHDIGVFSVFIPAGIFSSSPKERTKELSEEKEYEVRNLVFNCCIYMCLFESTGPLSATSLSPLSRCLSRLNWRALHEVAFDVMYNEYNYRTFSRYIFRDDLFRHQPTQLRFKTRFARTPNQSHLRGVKVIMTL